MEQGFPGQHTTATSVTVGTTAVNSTIRFDRSYLRTLPGMLKIAQMITSLLGFCCVTATLYAYNSRGEWFNTVAMGGFWYTGILLTFYLFHVIEKFHKIPWLKVEFIFCLIWTGCNFLSSVLIAAIAQLDGALGAAAFFGFVAMTLYGIEAWLKYVAIKKGDLAQGEHQPDKTVSSTISPTY